MEEEFAGILMAMFMMVNGEMTRKMDEVIPA